MDTSAPTLPSKRLKVEPTLKSEENKNTSLEENPKKDITITANETKEISTFTPEVDRSSEYLNVNGNSYKINSSYIAILNKETSSWEIKSTLFHILEDGHITVWKKYIVVIGGMLPFHSASTYQVSV